MVFENLKLVFKILHTTCDGMRSNYNVTNLKLRNIFNWGKENFTNNCQYVDTVFTSFVT